jgi:glycosyltransferase involved in cell wall biosynthesis
MSTTEPRLLIVYPHAGIDTNPTMTCLLESLALRRIPTDVLAATNDRYPCPASFGETIRLQRLPQAFFFWLIWDGSFFRRGSVRGFPGRLARKLLRPRDYRDYELRFDPVLFGLLRAVRYAAIVGVDPLGIAWANLLNRWANKPLVYVSFEIMFNDEDGEDNLKRLERAACAESALVLIQDDERAGVFCRETGFPRGRVVLVPVAPRPQNVAKTDYLRQLLGIPSDRRIVLYSGRLDDWSSRDQLAELVSYWPDRYCLVLHSCPSPGKGMSRYLANLKKTGKIYLTAQPLSREELPKMVASADFGLAPYIPVPENWMAGDNLYHLGLASGKVAFYAMCGLPILARTLPVFEREFVNYKCGQVYQRVADTGDLLQAMDKDYTHYSSEARRFYEERLNPVRPMEEFCDCLLHLAGYSN